MLDGVDSGDHGVLDALGAVRMRRNLAPRGVRLFNGRVQFLDRELRCAGCIAAGHDAPRGVDLDQIDAVLQLRTGDLPHLVSAIGDLEIALIGKHRDANLWREPVQIAVATSHRNSRPAGHHARPDEKAIVDGVPQIHRQEGARSPRRPLSW